MKRLSLLIIICLFFTGLSQAQDPNRKFPVLDVAWHPDGTKIAIAKGAWTCGPTERPEVFKVEIVSYPSLSVLYSINTDPSCPVRNLEWSHDGQYLVMGERGPGKAYTWRLVDQQIIAVSEPFSTYDRYMERIKPNDNVVANTTSGIGVSLWNLLTGQPIANVSEEESYSASWSPDGTKLVFGTYANNEIHCTVVETNTYTVITTFACVNFNPLWSPNGQWIITSTQQTVYLWNASTFTLENTWSESHGGSTRNKWSYDSHYFGNINADGTLSVRVVPQGTEIYTLTPADEITAFGWSPTGDVLYGQEVLPNTSLGVTMLPKSVIDPSAPTATPTAPATATLSPTPSYTCTVSGIATEAALKTAITNANALSTASILCLQPSSTITVTTLTNGAPNNSFGDSFLPLIQRDITIVGNGSTLTRSTSAVHGRFFRVAGADAKLTLDGITLTGGIASGNSKGGAVRVDSRMVILKNNTIITGNSAEAGGAIYNYLGTVQIENSTLSNNTVGTDGGALYGIGIFNLTNTIVSENKSSNNGGGMYVFNASGTLSQVTLTDSTFLSNEATNNGGGLSLMSGVTLTLNRGFITTNWAINFGGGMALTDANATVTTTEFEGNYSTNTQSRGGAIFMTGTDAALTVNAATFLNNTTKTSGGAIYNASGDINLTGGSFTGNQTQASGSDGGAIFSSNASAELKIQNVKFTSNSALDQGGAILRSSGTGFMSGSCLVTNTAANGAAVYSSNSFTATNNWWNNTTPPVNSQVTTSPVTPGATCPLG